MKNLQFNAYNLITIAIIAIVLSGCNEPKTSTLWLMGDSTMTDYANYGEDYMKERFPQTGWGQALPPYLGLDSLKKVRIIKADSLVLMNKARGGRSSRSFFEEGRWAEIYSQLKPGDWVIIQFGHNDASESKGERYVSIPGYKEFLRLYVNQTREKGATPILITSVCRNYPWTDRKLGSSHGDYPQAMKEVAAELSVYCIDLTQISAEYFTELGKDFVTENYFMNIPAGKYEAYPDGLSDNTHFQPAGAKAVAQLVFDALVNLQ
ncbi:MAG: rhamnogalacturonan acetylesterase [Tenuifilaceae bacterium]|jgi:lysophospholipase L1-like esterase|nr:rhamnogalacturonan acetylesterase [Tenuifilaceae bacterium]